ncbi:hypothetical protein ELS84_2628 [Enterococcus faecalis]|nr:hypothetical protein ELS84_2628 [Enterococcus faecalis]
MISFCMYRKDIDIKKEERRNPSDDNWSADDFILFKSFLRDE